MVLYTFRNMREWRLLKSGSPLTCDSSLVDKDYLAAYRWLARQMEMRLSAPPPSNVELPIWYWFKAHDTKQKPDLRRRNWVAGKDPHVLLTLDIPEEFVLLLDYQQWHAVLGNWHLYYTWDERERFKKLWSDAEHDEIATAELQQQKEASWERVFDLTTSSECWEPPEEKHIQAVTWILDPAWIIDERPHQPR